MMTIVISLFLLTYLFEMAQSVSISPCKVQRVMSQPQFGLSAQTNKIIEIAQQPTSFTQTIQADICVDSGTAVPLNVFPYMPFFVCRQRYRIVDVYVKSIEDLETGKTMTNPSGKQQAENSKDIFKKDFILLEAGCDTFIYYMPISRHQQNNVKVTSNLLATAASHGKLGDSRSATGLSTQQQIFSDELELVEHPSAALQPDFRDNSLKFRSIIKSDFFRKGMYLNSSVNTEENHHNYNSSENKHIKIINTSDSDNANEMNHDLSEGEVGLSADKIGLPVLILDSSIDPVMKIISHYSASK